MKPIDYFIMSGQSNMQGQSEGPPTLPAFPAGVFAREYKQISHTLAPIAHPAGEDILLDGEPLLLAAHQGFGGLLPDFAAAYAEKTGRAACYAHCAKGATTVTQWQKGTRRYGALLEKSTAGLRLLEKEGVSPKNRCLVWLQGESDGIERTSRDEYADGLLRLWLSLKDDLKLTHCLLIRVGYFHDFPCEPIMEAQELLCKTNADFHMISRLASTFTVENGLMQGPETAPFHYSNKGYAAIGADAGQNAAALLHG